ncbi:hypothetical protein MIND_00599700 [Mycena indigotica]|uniref:Epidermal growth factor receptor-like transmembrane-juxtamembrane segment domain-containing protein n=1 Tax=Mycena indigotica TaxID=2126181 RepID=A0A8H6SPZ8_9AGAR|nr:uncharacterized protein MIND_00599700 [Mycena indigotica]KAF7303703.1 hypothetical protein MIND_00599700 [Mycena indigotica]
MQVNSLCVAIFSFLFFFAPLVTRALIITAPSSGLVKGNNTISYTLQASDAVGLLTFFLARNSTSAIIAKDVLTRPISSAVPIPVIVPAGISGDGWRILAVNSDNTIIGQSSPLQVRNTPDSERKRVDGAVIGGVVAGVLVLAILMLVLFIFWRRRHQRQLGPTFDLETAFAEARMERDRSRSFSGSVNEVEMGRKWTEADKVEWERELEDQFARARAGTPSAMLRGLAPLRPQRAVVRN